MLLTLDTLIIGAVLGHFDACWVAVTEWFNLIDRQEAGEEVDMYVDRLPVLVHGYYLFT